MPGIDDRIVKCDAEIMSVGDANILALAMDCSVRLTREAIDVTAPLDSGKARRASCQIDWQMQVGKLVAVSDDFGDIMLSPATIVVSTDAVFGRTFYGVGLATEMEARWDDPSQETLTIQCSEGIAPSIGS